MPIQFLIALLSSVHLSKHSMFSFKVFSLGDRLHFAVVSENSDTISGVNLPNFILEVEIGLINMLSFVTDKELKAASQIFYLLRVEGGKFGGFLGRDSNILGFNRCNLGLDRLNEVKLFRSRDGTFEDLIIKLDTFFLKGNDLCLVSLLKLLSIGELFVRLHLLDKGFNFVEVSNSNTHPSLSLLNNVLISKNSDCSVKGIVIVVVVVVQDVFVDMLHVLLKFFVLTESISTEIEPFSDFSFKRGQIFLGNIRIAVKDIKEAKVAKSFEKA